MQPCSTNYAIIEQIYTSRHAIFKCYCQFLLNDHEISCMFLNCLLVFHRLFRMHFRTYICNFLDTNQSDIILFHYYLMLWKTINRVTDSANVVNFCPATLPVISAGVFKSFFLSFLILVCTGFVLSGEQLWIWNTFPILVVIDMMIYVQREKVESLGTLE